MFFITFFIGYENVHRFFLSLLVYLIYSTAFGYQVKENQSSKSLEKRLSPPYEVSISGVELEQEKISELLPGQEVYEKYCSMCHGYAVAGAPKTGDKEAWKKRMSQGWETIMSHALGGYKGMPAKGNCLNCSNDDIRESIEYILTLSDLEGVY
jgi:cytochrome c5